MILFRLLQRLLPALIPSWRFFKTVGPSPRIEVRRPPDTGAWIQLAPEPKNVPPSAVFANLFWNPKQNAALFRVSLAERVLQDDAVTARALLDAEVARALEGADPFEYRILFLSREAGQLTAAVCFESGKVVPA